MEAESRSFRLALPSWCDVALVLVIVISLGVLVIGWIGQVDHVVRIWPNSAAMVPSTALLFLALSIALILHRNGRYGPALLQSTAVAAIAISTVDLALILSGVSNGIDNLVFPGKLAFAADRMALATALCFFLAGISFFTLPTIPVRQPWFVYCTTIGWGLAMIALIGYLFDAKELYAVWFFSAMSLQTALCFVALFSAALLARPDRGWVRILASRGEGSQSARRLLPFVVLVPLALCYVVRIGTRHGWYGTDLRLSILAIAIIALLGTMVLRSAVLENRISRRLIATIHRLERSTNEKDVLLSEVYHRVKNNLQQISALIELEAREAPPDSQASFRTLAGRIYALSQVHHLLAVRKSPSTVDLSHFLSELCHSLLEGTLAQRNEVECEILIEKREVGVDQAVLLGLITNEIITNAIKHAFSGGLAGRLSVGCYSAEDETLILVIKDDGRIPDTQAAALGSGLGRKILSALVASLRGQMEVRQAQGTTVTVTIPPESLL